MFMFWWSVEPRAAAASLHKQAFLCRASYYIRSWSSRGVGNESGLDCAQRTHVTATAATGAFGTTWWRILTCQRCKYDAAVFGNRGRWYVPRVIHTSVVRIIRNPSTSTSTITLILFVGFVPGVIRSHMLYAYLVRLVDNFVPGIFIV